MIISAETTIPLKHKSPALFPDPFVQDAVALFLRRKQGHMERWEYSPPLFENDPAGGGGHWANLVKNPGRYYLTQGDVDTIRWAVSQPELLKAAGDINTVVELGPGSHEALLKKTVPFLNICHAFKHYVAVDFSPEQAAHAAAVVHQAYFTDTEIKTQDYFCTPLCPVKTGKTAIVMWGSSIGNIEGFANTNPFYKLVGTLRLFSTGMKTGDLLIFGFDTEKNKEKICSAYSEWFLSASILSPLYKLLRDGYVTGCFNPDVWRHESVWFETVGQCVHTIYPTTDQNFCLSGCDIFVPAGRHFVSNNSYKFSSSVMESAADQAGLDKVCCLQKGPIALFVAQKR